MELCSWLGIVVVLAIVTVVGHGIWVLLSKLGGARRSERRYEPTLCPSCRRLAEVPICLHCRRVVDVDALGATLADARKTLQDLLAMGVIDDATCAQLMESMRQAWARANGQSIGADEHAGARPAPPQPAQRTSTPPLPPVPLWSPKPQQAEPPAEPPTVATLLFAESARPVPAESPAVREAEPAAASEVRAVPSSPPTRPLPPRQPVSRMLAAFMEAKNIRWGELVGGMLIVFCSIALVVSLWSQISAIPVLKFFLFTAVTAALFAVGLYTHHRWRLPTTSRGILIIAMLLVPLNFLAIEAFSASAAQSAGGSEWLTAAGELVAVAIFLWLVFQGCRVIMPGWPWVMTAAVVGASVSQLLVRRLASPQMSAAALWAVAAIPAGVYEIAIGLLVRRGLRWRSITRSKGRLLLTVLGIASFAALAPLGLVVYRAGEPAGVLRTLSFLVAVLGLPALAVGLLMWQRVVRAGLAALRTAGTTVAMAGGLILMAGAAFAWPDPGRLLPVCLCDMVAFFVIARLFRIPQAHVLSCAFGTMSYLLACLVGMHTVGWTATPEELVAALTSTTTGPALLVPEVLFLAAWGLFRRSGQRADGASYAAAALAVAAISLALALWHGWFRATDFGATWVLAAYAALAAVVATVIHRRGLAFAAAWLLLAAFCQGFCFRFPEPLGLTRASLAWTVALLAYATVGVGVAIAARWLPDRQRVAVAHVAGALGDIAACVSIAVIWPIFADLSFATAAPAAARVFWLMAIWLATAILRGRDGVAAFAAAQGAMAFGVVLAVIGRLSSQTWFVQSAEPLVHPYSVQAIGVALAAVNLFWIAVRLLTRPALARLAAETAPQTGPEVAPVASRWTTVVIRLIGSPSAVVDRVCVAASLAGLVLLCLYGLIPGIWEECAASPAAGALAFQGDWGLCREALGGGGWLLAGATLVCLVAGLWERFAQRLVLAIIVTLAAVAALSAGPWIGVGGAASALRWFLAALWLIASVALMFPDATARLAGIFRWPGMVEHRNGLGAVARTALIVLTVLPVLALTLYRTALAIGGVHLFHPHATIFQAMGATVSYGVPLILLHIGLIGHAVRLRSSGYAFAGGLVLNLTASLAQLLAWTAASHAIGGVELIQLAQINAIASSLFAVAWMVAAAWLSRRTGKPGPRPPALLIVQVAIPSVINVLLILPALGRLIADPWSTEDLARGAGGAWGWAALAVAAAAAIWLIRVRLGRTVLETLAAGVSALCATGLTVGTMVAFDLSGVGGDNWAAFHTLLIVAVLMAWVALAAEGIWTRFRISGIRNPKSAIRNAEPGPESSSPGLTPVAEGWVLLIGAAAALLALRASAGLDPGRPWWASGSLVALSVLAAVMARVMLANGYLYLSSLLFNGAATLWWITQHCLTRGDAVYSSGCYWFDLAAVNLVAVAAPALASVWIVRYLRRAGGTAISGGRLPTFHRFASDVATLILAGLVVLGLFGDAVREPILAGVLLGWLAVLATLVAIAACRLDPGEHAAPGRLFALALIAVGLAINNGHLAPPWLGWTLALSLAGFSMATVLIWLIFQRARQASPSYAEPPVVSAVEPPAWFVNSIAAISIATFLLAFHAIVTFDHALAGGSGWPALLLRYIVAVALVIQTAAMAMLAHRFARPTARMFTLILSLFAVVGLAWAMIEPNASGGEALNRAAAFLVAAAIAAVGYCESLGWLDKRAGAANWADAVRRFAPWLMATAAGAVLVVIGSEANDQFTRHTLDIAGPAIAAVLATLALLIAAALHFAMSPGRDPLNLRPAGRQGYVYAAETLLVAMFLHVRLTMLWLFHGFFMQYWPLIVILIAFIGVALGERFQSAQPADPAADSFFGKRVLALPLWRTGIFLPLLPVLGFLALDSKVHFSAQLLLIGLLYGVVAIRRRSFGFALLAALAGNGGLWYFLHHVDGFSLMQHPQLWLIPFALSVLAAGYLNRDRLTGEQLGWLRYGCMTTVYLSSTVEIFLNGVAQSPWLPMVLAVLSVAGVLAGIMLRVRSFLFLGSVFLLLALVTMIWYASADLGWTWLWYVAGIVLGGAIITLFALFEKKRSQIVRVLNEMKEWGA